MVSQSDTKISHTMGFYQHLFIVILLELLQLEIKNNDSVFEYGVVTPRSE